MKLVSYDELPASYDPGRALIHLAAFGGYPDRRSIDLWRRRTSWLADYVGVFAVEEGMVVGQTFVQRIPFTFADRTETVSGIAGVSTRLDHARSGVARRILQEVHRREREAGIRYSTLWTNRSWGAHRLYEQLGYRDVYAPPWAVRIRPALRRHTRKKGVRPGRVTDLAQIEELHSEYARGRLGFAHRPPGFARVAAAAGELRPREEMLVSTEGGRLFGYAMFDSNRNRTVCGELVGRSAAVRARLAASVEARTRAGPTAFRDGAVPEMGSWLRERHYTIAPAGWVGLMATEFGRERSQVQLERELGTRDRRFLCLAGDRF